MENDPNKKESKGKRILKKALRRNSKSSNSGQGSALKQGIGESRSKNLDSKRLILEIKDSAPLPTADGTKEADHDGVRPQPPPDNKLILNKDNFSTASKGNKVDIHESHNETIGEAVATPPTNAKMQEIFRVPDEPCSSIQDRGGKRNLKRKLEEESGAGTSGASAGSAESDTDDKDPSKDKKKKNRCAVCRKKVGLTGFECRCGGLFCAVHRYSDKHECSFDYRELGAQEIRRNNPVVVSQKIHKI